MAGSLVHCWTLQVCDKSELFGRSEEWLLLIDMHHFLNKRCRRLTIAILRKISVSKKNLPVTSIFSIFLCFEIFRIKAEFFFTGKR